jgi:hypothetical protein
MSKKYLVPIRLANLAVDPTNQSGAIYFNDSLNKLKYNNGSAWLTVSSEGYVDNAISQIPPALIDSVSSTYFTVSQGQLNLNPDVAINSVSISDEAIGVTASSDVFGRVASGSGYPSNTNNIVATSSAESADYFFSITQGSNKRTSRITALFDGSSDPMWMEYGIVEKGSTINVTFDFVKTTTSYNFTVNSDNAFDLKGVVTFLS